MHHSLGALTATTTTTPRQKASRQRVEKTVVCHGQHRATQLNPSEASNPGVQSLVGKDQVRLCIFMGFKGTRRPFPPRVPKRLRYFTRASGALPERRQH